MKGKMKVVRWQRAAQCFPESVSWWTEKYQQGPVALQHLMEVDMENLMHFKDRLKEVRLSKHMNRAELERHCDLHKGSISMYEKGYKFPDMFTLFKLCKGVNVSADWLLGLKEDQK